MNRLDELTQLAIEGALTPGEERELEKLLGNDAAARHRFHGLIDTEIALRGLDERLDLSDAVMAILASDRHTLSSRDAARADTRVTQRREQGSCEPVDRGRTALSAMEAPPLFESVRGETLDGRIDRWTLRLLAPLAAAAAIALAFSLFHDRTDFEAPALSTVGAVTVADESGRAAEPARPLRAGDRIRVPDGAAGELSYRDRTRIDLAGGTELRVDADPARGGEKSKALELVAGTLSAEVAAQPSEQPLVVRTPHAVAVVRGTRFTLTVADDRTRLEVSEGRVDLFAFGATRASVVGAGSYAEADPAAGAVAPRVRPIRRSDGLLALYTFEEGGGDTVRDRSGRGRALDLTLSGAGANPLEWLPGGGIRFGAKGHLATREAAAKVIEGCRTSGEISVEAWVEAAASVGSGPGRIVTLSLSSEKLNFFLGQGTSKGDPESRFVARLRSAGAVDDWPAPAGSAKSGLSHLVLVRETGGRETLWLDGEPVAERESGGSLGTWHEGLPLGIGDDPGGENRAWRGACHLVAIYDRALSPEEVARHYEAGPR